MDYLNDKEYQALLKLYQQFNAAFNALPDYMKQAFFSRLFQK